MKTCWPSPEVIFVQEDLGQEDSHLSFWGVEEAFPRSEDFIDFTDGLPREAFKTGSNIKDWVLFTKVKF